MVAAEAVFSIGMVSPSLSSGPLAGALSGGLTATNTSPSGVAERNSTVEPLGS